MTNRASSRRPVKEAYYVQIENADKTPMFVNVSAQLGSPLSITKPLATTIMQVREDVILFSALRMYKKAKDALLSRPLALPPGPLERLYRSFSKFDGELAADRVRVDIDKDSYELEVRRDENGVTTLDFPGDDAVPTFTLPRSPLQLTIYLPSPRTPRPIVVGWQGYQGKPGEPDTVVRVVAQALNQLSGLAEFQVLSGISAVKVPAAPGRYQVITPTRKDSDRVKFPCPVRLWPADAAQGQVAAGQVVVDVDLDNANPATSQLLFHCVPDAAVEEHFAGYKPILDRALSATFAATFDPDELTDLVCNIALGDLSEGDLGRLREAAATVKGFDLSPREFRPFD